MKTYLVTGGAGFIGSNFINYLFDTYENEIGVINLDKLTYAGNLQNLTKVDRMKNYSFIKADICDSRAVSDVFDNNDIDFVINFAAESHVDRSILAPEAFVRTNILGAQILLEAAKRSWATPDGGFKSGKRFLQISTDEVYGSLGETGLFTEETPLNPHSPYSASKAGADFLTKAYYDTYKMPINITRCSNNYGSYQFPEKLIPLIICNCLEGKPLPVYGDGKNVRDWLYVEDHCRAIDKVLNYGRAGEVYNIGGNNERRNIEIVKMIINILRETLSAEDQRRKLISDNLIQFVTDRKGHDRRYAIDSSKIRKELGWEPKVSFEEGMKKTVKWYLENEDWIRGINSGGLL